MATSLGVQERDALRERLDRIVRESGLGVLDRSEINQLASLESDGTPIVSLYLDLGPQARLKRAWAVALKSLAREALASLDGDDAATVADSLARIEHALEERLPELGRGVAVFVCPDLDLWRILGLPLPLRNRIHVDRRPLLRPLLRVRDEHDLSVVVLLDKRRARLFLSRHGILTEVFDLFEDTPGHQKQGGWSQMRFQRHHDAHVLWHAAAVAQATSLLAERFRARNLLVSGTDEVLAEYRASLPPATAAHLVGEFSVPIDAPVKEILEAVEPLHRAAEAREEVSAVDAIHDAVSSGKGIWGLEETLQAVTEQRVMVLVCADRFRQGGGECLHCGLVTVDGEGQCPSCQHDMERVDDVVDLALEKAFAQDATIELVRSDDGRARLEDAAPIGALLRF